MRKFLRIFFGCRSAPSLACLPGPDWIESIIHGSLKHSNSRSDRRPCPIGYLPPAETGLLSVRFMQQFLTIQRPSSAVSAICTCSQPAPANSNAEWQHLRWYCGNRNLPRAIQQLVACHADPKHPWVVYWCTSNYRGCVFAFHGEQAEARYNLLRAGQDWRGVTHQSIMGPVIRASSRLHVLYMVVGDRAFGRE